MFEFLSTFSNGQIPEILEFEMLEGELSFLIKSFHFWQEREEFEILNFYIPSNKEGLDMDNWFRLRWHKTQQKLLL